MAHKAVAHGHSPPSVSPPQRLCLTIPSCRQLKSANDCRHHRLLCIAICLGAVVLPSRETNLGEPQRTRTILPTIELNAWGSMIYRLLAASIGYTGAFSDVINLQIFDNLLEVFPFAIFNIVPKLASRRF